MRVGNIFLLFVMSQALSTVPKTSKNSTNVVLKIKGNVVSLAEKMVLL